MNGPGRPAVWFVCVKNGGKSQIAAALLRHHVGEAIEVFSAGTRPGGGLNQQSRVVVEEIGATMAGEHPKLLDPALVADVDRIVVLGAEAVVEPPTGLRGTIETWITDEPSLRGIDGLARMRLVRDDIDHRVRTLAAELSGCADTAN